MKYFVRLVILILLLALSYWAWGFFFPNPQKIIHQRLDKLARLASFGPHEGNIAHVAAIEQIRPLFAKSVEVSVNIPGESHTFNDRDELMQAALAARSSLTSLKIQFEDINTALSAADQSAIVSLTVKASVNGEQDAVVEQFKIIFKKINGDWVISHVETVSALRL